MGQQNAATTTTSMKQETEHVAETVAEESQKDRRNVVCVIPAYNSGESCIPVIQGVKSHIADVILVDDGSDPETAAMLDEAAGICGCQLMRHPRNLGKGHALATGFAEAIKHGATHVMTIDADGQHDPKDIPALLRGLEGDPALVIGSRDPRQMPTRSRFGNVVTSHVMKAVFGVDIPDTQSGFRIYSAKFLSGIDLKQAAGRYETEMRILANAATNKEKIAPLEIKTIYFYKNKNSKFSPLYDSLRIYSTLIPYTIVSMLSFCVDYVVYLALLSTLLPTAVHAHMVSRAFSVVFNFSVNKYFVFRKQKHLLPHALGYATAAAFTLLNSSILLWLATDGLLHLNPIYLKVVIDGLLFLGNYFMVRCVFENREFWLLKRFKLFRSNR